MRLIEPGRTQSCANSKFKNGARFRRAAKKFLHLHPLPDPRPSTLSSLSEWISRKFGHCQLAQLGHQVRLIPPAYVKPFVKRQKNDANDAEAICEAA
jgi:hypothetical protein